MTSQKDQIQALITDIDGILQKTTPRLPWVVSGEVTQQRQVLERVRNYLVAYQRRQIAGEGFGQAGARPDLLAHDIYYQPQQTPYQQATDFQSEQQPQAYGQAEASAQQMLQAIAQEMGALRTNLMQPLQSDLEVLRQQREMLLQDIRQLEAQRQGYGGYGGQLPGQQQIINEFLQALMSRLQETLPQQVAQSLAGTGVQPSLPYAQPPALAGAAPHQGLGTTQLPQASADELLIKLDSTLSVVFESLQRNVQAYEASLSQGLDKMHSMGQQGEMMFTALINHLAQQLGREASSYLQSSTATGLDSARAANAIDPAATGAPRSTPAPKVSAVSPSLEQPDPDAAIPNLTLPFPGTEIASTVADPSATAPAPSVDTAIDYWLRSAGKANPGSDVDLEIAALDLDGFDLNQLAAQDVNTLLELDANLLSADLSPQPLLSPLAPGTAAPATSSIANVSSPDPTPAEDTADIDAALKLLEQLSSELQDQPASVADADAQIDRMLSSPTALTNDATATDGIPDDARDELDEFYESLFGNQVATADAPPETPAAATSPPLEAAPDLLPADAQGIASSAVVQPVDTLPAAAHPPAGDHTASTASAPPTEAAIADPTLGWDLQEPSIAAPAVAPESDIPEALLEDELLGVWDLADTETVLAAPVAAAPVAAAPTAPEPTAPEPAVPAATGNDLLSGWDLSPIGHDQAAPSELVPLTDVPSNDRAAETAASSAPQGQPLTGSDEISSLTALFDAIPTEAPNAAIVDRPPSEPPQPLAEVPPAYPPLFVADSTQTNLAEAADDRYTPASPEEDLLPTGEPDAEPESELWLDESTLSRLSEDLFNLEDAIADPSTPLYSPESDASVFSADTPAADPMTQPATEPSLFDDWGSVSPLDAVQADATTALPTDDSASFPLETDQSSVIAEEPPTTFTLEGMNALLANTPIAPPVTSVPPPVPSTTTEATIFTLEGMDDLFGDTPPVSTAPLPTAPAPDLPIPPAPTPAAPAIDQPLPFTLEGMDDLFGDAPSVNTAPLPTVPPSMPPAATLSAATPPAPAIDPPLPFTLDGMDDLFADAPPTASMATEAPTPPAPTAEQAAPSNEFTLEQVGDVFVEVPSGTPAPAVAAETTPAAIVTPVGQVSETAPFTLEQVGNLFAEVPAEVAPPSAEAAIAPPSNASPPPPAPTEAPAPFTLEQMGDLFVETPTGAASGKASGEASVAEASSPAIAPPLQAPSPPQTSPPPSTLEQAFASLLGDFDESPAIADSPDAPTLPDEKKKEMS